MGTVQGKKSRKETAPLQTLTTGYLAVMCSAFLCLMVPLFYGTYLLSGRRLALIPMGAGMFALGLAQVSSGFVGLAGAIALTVPAYYSRPRCWIRGTAAAAVLALSLGAAKLLGADAQTPRHLAAGPVSLGLLVLGAAEAGRRRGFASGLVSLIGSVAGIIGGTYGTRVWAGGIYDKYVAGHVTDVVADTLEKTGGDLAQAIHALTFLPQSIQQKLIDTVSAASSNAVPQVVNALEPLFLPVIQAVVFLSVWIVVRVLCRMLGRVLRGINAIPLIGGLNRILGFAFGFVSGLLNCWIWSILLWVAANLTGGKLEFLTTATLNRSVIYGLLANLNPFLTRY